MNTKKTFPLFLGFLIIEEEVNAAMYQPTTMGFFLLLYSRGLP